MLVALGVSVDGSFLLARKYSALELHRKRDAPWDLSRSHTNRL